MFKFITLSCLLAVGAQCKTPQNTAVPYYPQPYPNAPNPQFYAAQPKYNAQPAYVAAAPYRQVLVPASPAYNPYYYGYAPYPAYPQQYAYPYVQNDGTQAPAAAQPGWGEYLSSIWNYVPNYPFGGSSESQASGAESASSAASSASTAESSAAEASPGKGDKPTEGQKVEQQSASNEQSTAQSPPKQSAPAAFEYFGHPQYFGQLPYQPAAYDPTKLNTASNGAVSNFWFYRNQAQPEFQAPQSVFQAPQPVFQAPQPFADQKYYQNPAQFNHGTAALAYQRYLQYQKQQQGQFQEGQFQQQHDQQFQQQQPQPAQSQDQQFQQQPSFEQQSQKQQQQQYEQQSQQDESSVVVDSNVAGAQEAENQPQSKLATGPTIAVAQPQGMAFAGIGGRAGAGPIGTAIVGNNSTAISEPSGTAISLDLTPTINLTPVHKLTSAYVAKYAPELGVYRVAEIKTPAAER